MLKHIFNKKHFFFHLVSSLSLFIFSFIFSLLLHRVSSLVFHLLSSCLLSSLLSIFSSLLFHLLFSRSSLQLSLIFSLLSSLVFLSLLSHLLLHSCLVLSCLVFFCLLFSCLSSAVFSSLSVRVFFLCLSLCLCLCFSLSPCGVVLLCCVVVCVVWHRENPVYPLKTCPCGGEGEGHRQFCLPKFAHIGLSRASEVHRRNFWIFPIFKFENRLRTTRARFLLIIRFT